MTTKKSEHSGTATEWFLILVLLTIAASSLVMASCAGPRAAQSPFGTLADAESLLLQDAGDAVLAASTGPAIHGRVRVLHGSQACNSKVKGQGNPMVWCRQPPIVGEPHRIQWTVNPTGPFDIGRPAFLLVWFEEPKPTDLTPFGYDGCLLWGPLDPRQLFTLQPANGSPFTQEGGTLELNWTPPQAWLGKRVFSQLVVYSPGANAQHWLLSPALECWVGNRH